MMRGNLPEVIEYNQKREPAHPTLGDLRSGNEYSNELVNLLAKMLHPDPDSRANCQDIMNAYVENREVWLEMADPNVARNFETSNLWLHWREGDGKWGIGTVFDNPERSEDFRAKEAKRLKRIADDVRKRAEDKKKKKKKEEEEEEEEEEEDKKGSGDDGDDGDDGTVKKPMTPSEAGKVAGKHLPKKATALPQKASPPVDEDMDEDMDED
ncbi:hypothetical protein VTO58DRAFT_107973 [Aureobasidium pullulans]